MAASETDALLSRQENYQETSNNVVGRDTAYKGGSEDPREWSKSFKWVIVMLLAFLAFNVTFTCIAIIPLANTVVLDLGKGNFSKSASVLLVTIWELGEAAGPLFFAPLSEMFGRRIVLNSANALFVLAAVLGALSQSVPLFIITRALGGLAVASNTLSPSIISDIFVPEERGSALAFLMTAPLVGSAIGPVVGGIVGERLGWRQIIWTSVILASMCQLLLLTIFKETYKASIRQTKSSITQESVPDSLWISATRPAQIFCSSMVLMVLCVFHAINFATYYVMAVTLPDILETKYGLSPAVTGSSFLLFTVGLIIALTFCRLTLDRYYKYLSKRNKGVGQPEFWLPCSLGCCVGVPASIMLYGWAAQVQLPLPVFLLSLVSFGTSLCLAFVPLFAYVVEAFDTYSASATAGVIVTRCLAAVFFPLLIEPLVRKFDYGLTFTMVAAASACVGPIPILVMKYGQRWRQFSKYTRIE